MNHAKQPSRFARYVQLIAGIFIVVGIVLVAVACSGCSASVTHNAHGAPKAAVQAQTPYAVEQPPTASVIATELKCSHFQDKGPSPSGTVLDSGTCKIGAVKYAIDTFASQDVRDSWLKAAEPLGVNPKWETTTSVTYKSVA